MRIAVLVVILMAVSTSVSVADFNHRDPHDPGYTEPVHVHKKKCHC